MSLCGKCGVEMNKEANYCKACGSGVRADAWREQKKARVMGREKTWTKLAAITVGLVFAAIAAWMLKDVATPKQAGMRPNFAPQREQQAAPRTQAVAVNNEGNVVRIPLAAMEDGMAHFFAFASGKGNISFFAMRAPDGGIRTAFDACIACNHAKLGYRQEGDHVVCNNCAWVSGPQTSGMRPAAATRSRSTNQRMGRCLC